MRVKEGQGPWLLLTSLHPLCPSHLLQPQSRDYVPTSKRNWDSIRHFQRGYYILFQVGKGRNRRAMAPLQQCRKHLETLRYLPMVTQQQ